MTKYEVIIYWSEEDQAFIAEVPELPGCAADGPTRQAALRNADLVIKEWIRDRPTSRSADTAAQGTPDASPKQQ